MPGGDRTGPMGQGPMTGRAAGFCGGYGTPGFMNRGAGTGFGRAGGRGWRHRFFATGLPGWARWGGFFGGPTSPSPEQEKQLLQQQVQNLQQTLAAMQKRIDELEADGS